MQNRAWPITPFILFSAEEDEKPEEEPERPSPSGIRLPPGARGMPGMGGAMPMPGMGGGFMSELKKKQRQSAMPAVSGRGREFYKACIWSRLISCSH